MLKISIKTVDGGRFDYTDHADLIPSIGKLFQKWESGCFLGFPVDGGTKYFNRDTIVSITAKEIDDE